jgi:hypothetical protein
VEGGTGEKMLARDSRTDHLQLEVPEHPHSPFILTVWLGWFIGLVVCVDVIWMSTGA